ncbi:chemokine XC receptor 1 [Silurus asotus]|uniref:Chemokine XC receptor 1 n=1 Tax=Silurus asotus TaxID=30991 RepID=A0AAD5A4I9_SILAS|nr:chemokine XC receptor 1 [Silurus asotus]
METKVYSNDVDHYRAPSYGHATAFWIMANKQITISILLGIVVLLSLVGNILVVVASVLYLRLRSLMSIFILNLALSDLLFTVGLLFWICDYIWHLDLGNTVCKIYRFFFSLGCYSNVVFQVLMSFQRYMAVVHPRTGWKKGQSVKDVLICAWVMSILAALPVTVHFKTYPYLEGCTYSSNTGFAAKTSTPMTFTDYNTYVDFYSNEMDSKVSQAEYRHIEIPIVLIIVISLSLIGNILVVGFSIFYMRFRTLTSITILNLALSDLLLTSQPVFRVYKSFWPWTLTDAACKVFDFLSSIGFYSSMVFLVLMSVQRYMAVVHLTQAGKQNVALHAFLYVHG